MDRSVNVFGEPRLEDCNQDPVTGFFRDGCCNTSDQDLGSHTVCVRVTKEFLEFSASQGQRPVDSAPGIRVPWAQARRPLVPVRGALGRGVPARHGATGDAQVTHARALEVVPLSVLRKYAADLN